MAKDGVRGGWGHGFRLQVLDSIYIEGENRCDIAGRWVELRRDIDFARLRGGKQLVNHIQNSDVVTTKVR